jgi:hypothetical protein
MILANFALHEVSTAAYNKQQAHLRSIVVVVDHGIWPMDFNNNKNRLKKKLHYYSKCVTMIDPATSWFEIHQYHNKQAITVANIDEEEWFSRYP